MDLSFLTADLLNETPWADGIIYIALFLGCYAFCKWINKKFS